MPEQVTVTIPDGEYCSNCKFCSYYDIPLVDIMGNETGNRKQGYECKLHDMPLDEVRDGCFINVKKCDFCRMDKKTRTAMWWAMFGTFLLMNGQQAQSIQSEREQHESNVCQSIQSTLDQQRCNKAKRTDTELLPWVIRKEELKAVKPCGEQINR